MPELLSTGKLQDGRNVEVFRIVTPEANVPDKVKRYLMASLSYELYRNYYYDQAYWRLYYREALDGHTADYAVDHIYYAEVEGFPAARVWFAYNKRTGRGNFGNVYTEPEFRQLGLMNMLLEPCVQDFHKSPAKMLCCASGNKFAVNSYLKRGFKLIYGGETGPLCLSDTPFADEEQRAFPGGEELTIRQGTPGDQFDCDKFLYYTRAMYGHKRNHHVGIASRITEYRIAYQEQLSGNGIVNVAETPSGNIVGYVFALQSFGENVLDFNIHFGYMEQAESLLRLTADEFNKTHENPPLIFIAESDIERERLVRKAGFEPVATVPGRFTIFK